MKVLRMKIETTVSDYVERAHFIFDNGSLSLFVVVV